MWHTETVLGIHFSQVIKACWRLFLLDNSFWETTPSLQGWKPAILIQWALLALLPVWRSMILEAVLWWLADNRAANNNYTTVWLKVVMIVYYPGHLPFMNRSAPCQALASSPRERDEGEPLWEACSCWEINTRKVLYNFIKSRTEVFLFVIWSASHSMGFSPATKDQTHVSLSRGSYWWPPTGPPGKTLDQVLE